MLKGYHFGGQIYRSNDSFKELQDDNKPYRSIKISWFRMYIIC